MKKKIIKIELKIKNYIFLHLNFFKAIVIIKKSYLTKIKVMDGILLGKKVLRNGKNENKIKRYYIVLFLSSFFVYSFIRDNLVQDMSNIKYKYIFLLKCFLKS